MAEHENQHTPVRNGGYNPLPTQFSKYTPKPKGDGGSGQHPYAGEGETPAQGYNPQPAIFAGPPRVWPVFLLTVAAVSLLYVLFAFREPVIRMVLGNAEPVMAQLKAEYYRMSLQNIFLALPVAAVLAMYLIHSAAGPMKAAAKRRARARGSVSDAVAGAEDPYAEYRTAPPTGKWRLHVFYPLMLLLTVLVLVVGIAEHQNASAARCLEDIKLLEQGDVLIYQGQFHPTSRPKDNQYGFVIVPDKAYYYFSAETGTLRCVRTILPSDQLMQSAYRVEYLPNTYTVVSIAGLDGSLVTGLDSLEDSAAPGEGYWKYGDLSVRRCEEIYGYAQLTEEGRMAFDLLYGEYFSRAVLAGEESTHSFDLPEPLSSEEYNRVLSLYKAATFRYSRPPMRYATDDRGTIKRVYAGGVINALEERNSQFFVAQEKAESIVAGMPRGLDDVEKCYYLSKYLVETVQYYGSLDNGKPKSDLEATGTGIKVAESLPEYQTGYGALLEGRANCLGYAKAFFLLAHEAGLTVIPVYGHSPTGGHAWNMVLLEGEWYHIDVTWMDDGQLVDETYFLADDEQIAATHRPLTYGDCTFVSVPPARDIQGTWLAGSGRSFAGADEAMGHLLGLELEQMETAFLRLESQEAVTELLGRAGEVAGLNLSVRGSDWGVEQVVRVRRADYISPEVDWRALQEQVPYPGNRSLDEELEQLPHLQEGDARAVELGLEINRLLAGYGMTDQWDYHAKYPDTSFLAYAALRHTWPVTWSTESPLYPDRYYEALEPYEGATYVPEATEGVLAAHLERTAGALFGEDIALRHRDVWEQAHNSGFTRADWVYDSARQVYVRQEPEAAQRFYCHFAVLDYGETDDRVEILAARVWYQTGPGASGYLIGPGDEVLPGTDPRLRDYLQSEGRQALIALDKEADGTLRLLRFAWVGMPPAAGQQIEVR